MKTLNCIDID